MAGTWRSVSKGRRCPVCGGHERCSLGEVGVYCYKWDRPAGGATGPGWIAKEKFDPATRTWMPGVPDGDGGMLFERVEDRDKRVETARRAGAQVGGGGGGGNGGGGPGGNGDAAVEAARVAAELRAKREADSEKFRLAAIAKAKLIWKDAQKNLDHPRARAYFAARGVPLDRLPGGKLPQSIGFVERCEREGGADGDSETDFPPAIVAAFADHGADPSVKGRKVVAVQRIYLHPTEARKADGISKKTRGSLSSGQAVRLTGPGEHSGTCVVCEGIETGMAILASVPAGVAVWCTVSTSGMQSLTLNDFDAHPEGGWMRQLVIAGDLDSIKKNGKRPGHEAAGKCVAGIRREWPELSVLVKFPDAAIAPTLVDATGNVIDGGGADGGEKSVDWLDVLKAVGPDAVGKALAPAGAVKVDRNRYLPETRTERAQTVLRGVFNPPPLLGRERVWSIARFAGKWWVYYGNKRGRWVQTSDELVGASVLPFFDRFYVRTKSGSKLAALTNRAIEDIMRAVVCYTAVSAEQMPAWLPRSHDDKGVARFDPLKLEDVEVDGPAPASSVVAFPNGLLNVRAWVDGVVDLIPPTPRWFSRSCLPFALPVDELRAADSADKERALVERLCPEWLKFLDFTFGASELVIGQLQRWFGYCLTSDTRFEKLLWLQGMPGTGKTTITDMLAECVGRENVASTSFTKLAQRFDLASLVGRSVILVPEVHIGFKTDAAAALEVFKEITGNSPVSIEDKFQAVRTNVRLTGKFVVTPNEEPSFSDASAALLRRLLVLPTGRAPTKADPMLKTRLAAEAHGIMIWALYGLRALERDGGFTQPAEGQTIAHELKRSMSPVLAWIEDECVVQPGSSVASSVALTLFHEWAKREGMNEWKAATFGKALAAAVPGIERTERQLGDQRWRVYTGFRPRMGGETGEALYPPIEVNEWPYPDMLLPSRLPVPTSEGEADGAGVEAVPF